VPLQRRVLAAQAALTLVTLERQGRHSHAGAWERSNPVKRGYVELPEHWRYSSARNYLGQVGLIEIDPWH